MGKYKQEFKVLFRIFAMNRVLLRKPALIIKVFLGKLLKTLSTAILSKNPLTAGCCHVKFKPLITRTP